MNEERRPNVAGQPVSGQPGQEEGWDQEALRRDAHLLGDREDADGHEGPAEEPAKE